MTLYTHLGLTSRLASRSAHRDGMRGALLSHDACHDGADLLGVGEGRGVAADGGTSYHAYSAAATEHLTRD